MLSVELFRGDGLKFFGLTGFNTVSVVAMVHTGDIIQISEAEAYRVVAAVFYDGHTEGRAIVERIEHI